MPQTHWGCGFNQCCPVFRHDMVCGDHTSTHGDLKVAHQQAALFSGCVRCGFTLKTFRAPIAGSVADASRASGSGDLMSRSCSCCATCRPPEGRSDVPSGASDRRLTASGGRTPLRSRLHGDSWEAVVTPRPQRCGA